MKNNKEGRSKQHRASQGQPQQEGCGDRDVWKRRGSIGSEGGGGGEAASGGRGARVWVAVDLVGDRHRGEAWDVVAAWGGAVLCGGEEGHPDEGGARRAWSTRRRMPQGFVS